MRKFLAYIVAPVVPAILLAGASLFVKGELLTPYEFLVLAVPSYLITLLCLIFFGLPLVALLKKTRTLNLLSASVAGVVAGTILFFATMKVLARLLDGQIEFEFRVLILGAILGLATALVFAGVLARTNRPADVSRSI